MTPPGRRKLSTLSSIVFLFLAFTHTASAAASILGIDLGTSYLKGVLVKPGIPLEIVLSKDSKRKEAAAVAFKPVKSGPLPVGQFPERAYGPDALALAARFPGDVYPNLKPLLGKLAANSDAVSTFKKARPALQLTTAEDRGTVAFKSGSFEDAEREWSVEELLAMELKNLRQNAETLAKGKVDNAVITVPTFFTARERNAVELAAKLAGLQVMSLISDGLAIGMNYAMTRTLKKLSDGGHAEHHMVFDMGSGSTTATVFKFQARDVKDVGKYNRTIHELTVLGTGWDQTLGGEALNGLVYDNMIEKFLDSPDGKKLNVDASKVKGHGRAAAKLLKDAERVRQVLSANSETGASFESLYEDVDFKYKLSRAEFEEMASSLTTRLEAPIKAALSAAKLTFDDLDSVILHGGVSRTPLVQKSLERLAGGSSKLRSNVNADEAAVFGAAFKGASLSPSFRVKEIWDSDAASYAVNIKWTYDGKERKQKIFTPTSLVGAVPKQVSFKNVDDFDVTFTQLVPTSADSSATEDVPVLKIETKNLTASVEKLEGLGCAKTVIDTVLQFRLDPVTSLPEVVSGSVSCEVEEVEKKSVVDGVKNLFGFGGKKDQEVLQDDKTSTTEAVEEATESASASTESSPSATSSADAKSTDAAKSDAKDATPKKRVETIYIDITSIPLGFEQPSKKEFTRMKKRLNQFDSADQDRRDHEESLNTLEGFIYKARDLLTQDSFTEFMKPEELRAANELTASLGEWISEEGAKSELNILKEKLKSLKAVIDPVTKRKDEAATLPEAIKLLEETFNRTTNLRDAMQREVDTLALAAAEKSSSEAAASASSTAAAEPSTGTDTDTEDLDVDEATSTTSSSAKPTPTSSYTDDYTDQDVLVVGVAYDNIKKWYDETSKEQDALTKDDDPVLLTADINQRVGELNDVMWQMVQKKIRFNSDGSQQKPKKSKTSKSKTSKTKTSKKAKPTKAAKDAGSAASDKVKSLKDKVSSSLESVASKATNVPKHEEL